MADECVIHFNATSACNDTILQLNTHQRTNILTRAEQWLSVDKFPEAEISRNILNRHKTCCPAPSTTTTSSSSNDVPAWTAHNSCYLRFASASKLQRAQEQRRKVSKNRC